jgi:transcriptional regulator with XRE-family HTH domain
VANFTYKSYNFVDKDPIIDEIRTVYQDSGVNYRWIEENSGVTSATLSAWFNGKTRKPQAATINAVLRSLGYKLGIVEYGKQQVKVFPAMEQPKTSVRHQNVVTIQKYNKFKKAKRR